MTTSLPPFPSIANLEYFLMAGQDATSFFNQCHIFFTMKKSYHTCQLLLLDSTNDVQEILSAQNPPQVQIGFNCGENIHFDGTFYVYAYHNEQIAGKNPATKKYVVECVGPEFFSDQCNIVQEQFQPGTTATTAINMVSSKYLGLPCQIVQPSIGPLNQETNHTTNATSPFRCINDLCQRANFGNMGNALHFKNQTQGVIGPLDTIVAQASPLMDFYQNQTIGMNWLQDIAKYSPHTMLRWGANADERGSVYMGANPGSGTQINRAFDLASKKYTIDGTFNLGQLVSAMPGVGAITSAFRNFMVHDTRHVPTTTSRQQKNPAERFTASQWGMFPQVSVQVPLQKALVLQPGKGVYLGFLPATSDYQNLTLAGDSYMTGNYCVKDLCFSIHMDDRPENLRAYSNFNAVKQQGV